MFSATCRDHTKRIVDETECAIVGEVSDWQAQSFTVVPVICSLQLADKPVVVCGFSGGATSAVALAARLSKRGIDVLHVVVDSGIPGSEPPGQVPVTVLHYDDPQEYWENTFEHHWQGFNATLIAHQSGHAQGLNWRTVG